MALLSRVSVSWSIPFSVSVTLLWWVQYEGFFLLLGAV